MSEKICCEDWQKATNTHNAFIGGGLLYPPGSQPSGQIELAEDGTWAINGCCGGGCFVVSKVKFCPFCGAKVTVFKCEEAKLQEGNKDGKG